jgi:hypothetical protein
MVGSMTAKESCAKDALLCFGKGTSSQHFSLDGFEKFFPGYDLQEIQGNIGN